MKSNMECRINKYFLSAVFLIIFLSPVFGQVQLENYLKTAAENNPHLKSLFKQYMAALEKVPQVGTLPDPQLAFGYFVQPVETRLGAQQATISGSQMFPWFGTLSAQERVATERAKARFKAFEDAKYKLFFDVKSTYFNLYVLEEAIRITDETLDLLSSFKNLATIKFEAGKKDGMIDVLRVEMDIEELKEQLAYLIDTELPLVAQFEQLLNTKLEQEVTFPDVLWLDNVNIDKKAIYDSIIAQNPILQKLEHEALSWNEQIDVARRLGMPSFVIGMSYINISERTDIELPDNGKDAIMLPQVGIKIPLYRNKYNAMINEASLQKEAVQFEKENTSNVLETYFEKGYRDYLDGIRRVKLYLQLLTFANQALDILITDYTSAGKDFEEVLRMEKKVLKYELELEKARADQNTAVAYINYLMGK
ncbi:MAG: TolC family protein [Bacteroidetes bacterium]|nr:TolC family protein [Bacteroidota bacterium]